jgi:transposase-like protein
MAKNATVAQNYSAETTAKMVSDYLSGVAVEAIAVEIGKSVRSVVAKLSREGVYVAKSKADAEKSARETKSVLVSKIAEKFGVDAEALVSLEKATKGALEILAA